MKPDSSELVYRGDFLSVTRERWGAHDREIVERPDVVAILPIDQDGLVTLVKQLRPPARRALTELPAGRIEPGEEPLEGAKRELREETGLTGGAWRPLRTFWTTPGFCRERVHLFTAEGLDSGPAAPADDEEIQLVRVPVAELPDLLGQVEDAKTLVGVLLYLQGGR